MDRLVVPEVIVDFLRDEERVPFGVGQRQARLPAHGMLVVGETTTHFNIDCRDLSPSYPGST